MRGERDEYIKIEKSGFFTGASGYLEGRADFDSLRATLGKTREALQPVFQRNGSPLLQSVLGLVHNALNMSREHIEASREQLAAYIAQMKAGRDRLADMLRVNQALRDDSRWPGVFTDAGLVLENEGEIRYRGQHHAGKYYVFNKPGGGPGQSHG